MDGTTKRQMPPAAQQQLLELLEDHERLMYSACSRYVRGADSQAEVLSEATARICERYDEIEHLDRPSLTLRLVRTVEDVARAYVRSDEARRVREHNFAFAGIVPNSAEEDAVARLAFLDTVATLPHEERVAFILDSAGIDSRPIAELLEIDIEKVESRVARGRRELRSVLAHRYGEIPQSQLDLIEQYVDDSSSLTKVRRSRVRRHLKSCDACHSYMTVYAGGRVFASALIPPVIVGGGFAVAGQGGSPLIGWLSDLTGSVKAQIGSIGGRPEVAQAASVASSAQGSGIRPAPVVLAVAAVVFAGGAVYTVGRDVVQPEPEPPQQAGRSAADAGREAAPLVAGTHQESGEEGGNPASEDQKRDGEKKSKPNRPANEFSPQQAPEAPELSASPETSPDEGGLPGGTQEFEPGP